MPSKNTTSIHHVSGHITDAYRFPVDGFTVKIYDRDLRSEELIGETTTNRDGAFFLSYSPEKIRKGEKKYADLLVRVHAPGKRTALNDPSMEDVRFNARKREVIDITLDWTPRDTDEFTRYLQDIAPLQGKVKVHELDENDKHRDVSFLYRESDIPRQHLEHLILAHRLAHSFDFPAEVAFGLFRMDTLSRHELKDVLRARFQIHLDSDPELLMYDISRLDPKQVQKDLKEAVKRKIIPSNALKQYSGASSQLKKLQKKAEAHHTQEKPGRILNLMSGFLLENKIDTVKDLLAGSRGDLNSFLRALEEKQVFSSSDQQDRAEATLLLGSLLGYNKDLTAEVEKAAGIKKKEDLPRLMDMKEKDLKKVFGNLKGEGKARNKAFSKKAAEFHARSLVSNLEVMYPSAAYRKYIREDKKPVSKEIASFLEKHADFDLKETRSDTWFREKKLTGKKDEKLKAELKKHQRIIRLVPQYEQAKGLLSQDVHSAQSIVALGKGRFVKEVGPKAGMSEKEAKAVFKKAEEKHAATMLLVADLNDMHEASAIAAMGTKSMSLKMASVGEDFPTLKNLFQLTDMCECEHCRSVYSPAAYMVELLQFLDNRLVMDTTVDPPVTGTSAKDALFDRRPDLGDLDLSCDNANVPVPYIDLVCEILEEYIAPDPGFDFTGALTDGAIPNNLLTDLQNEGYQVTDKGNIFPADVNGDLILRDKEVVLKLHNTGGNNWNIRELRQTYGTAAELAASPYYVNEAAYDMLKNSVYAFGLPFHLAHEEGKAYFDRFGIRRSELMHRLQTGGNPSDSAIAAERLGLTIQQKDLIITIDTGNQQTIWNTGGPAVAYMKVVANMLDKTGLTYKQLEELLGLSFIGDDLYIKHGDDSCDLTNKTIENLTLNVLDRMHRFLRLQKKTGWPMPVLNELIQHPGGGLLNEACLISLGRMVEISRKTGLKVEVLAGFYGNIPHEKTMDKKYSPLYHQVFLNKAVNGPVGDDLLPENIPGAVPFTDFTPEISLALKISEDDLGRLAASMANTDLTWENLSYLFAAVRFSEASKLSIRDFLHYRELTATDPFDSPQATLEFINKLEKARYSSLTPADVRFMLFHEAEDLSVRELPDEKIQSVLEDLQEAYASAFMENASPFSNSMTVEELSVFLKNTLLRLPDLEEETANDFVKMARGQWNEPPMPAAAGFIDLHLADYMDTAPVKAAQAALVPGEDDTDPADGATKKAFIQAIMDPLSAYFTELDKDSSLISLLALAFRQDEELVETVVMDAELGQPGGDFIIDLLKDDSLIDVNDPENLPPVNEATYPDQYDSLRLLHKLLPLVASLDVPVEDLSWWMQASGPMGWLQPDTIPYKNGQVNASFDDWLALIRMIRMASVYPNLQNPADPEEPYTFSETLDLLLTGPGADWLEQVAVITGHDPQAVADLDAHFSWSVPNTDEYKDPDTWEQLEAILTHIRKMNITVAQAVAVSKDELTPADTSTLRTALKTRYSDSLWLETLKEIMNKVRSRKRDALVAYLLAEDPDATKASDLYDYLLIDTEMEACMPSSRIVQAHGVIQLFVQRCLMGLEPATAADTVGDPAWEQWKWMKMYRVWEANRKVFLYPENWILPELLDDKSFLFSELENELLQNELNEFTSEEAIIRYVERLDDISFLEVMATYYETTTYTMHVFGRSKGGDPPQYYYRRFEHERYWTPWEKVPLEISSNQLVAFKRNSRLHLAWPVFSEEHNPDQQVEVTGIDSDGTEQNLSVNQPELRLKVQLAISQLANGQWKPKKMSQDAILTRYTANYSELDRNKYNLYYDPFSSSIIVFHSSWGNNHEWHVRDGIFSIAGCQGYPELLNSTEKGFPDFFPDIHDAFMNPQRYIEQGIFESPDNLVIVHVLSFFGLSERLEKTPNVFRITHPFQMNLFDIIAYLMMMMFYSAVGGKNDYYRYAKVPFGTLFPHFFEDSHQAYVAVPGLYRNDEDENGKEFTIRRTFSDIHQLVMDIWALIVKYIGIYQASGDIVSTFQQLVADPDYLAIVEELEVYKTLQVAEEWHNFYYPMMCRLRTELYRNGVDGIMKRAFQLDQTDFDFQNHYGPSSRIVTPYPVEDFDFDSDGSYSGYNWELFFHTPLMIANRLRDDHKFDEAFRWYHYMFNPTGTLEGDVPQKYWVTKPFFQQTAADYADQRIDNLLYRVAAPGTPEIAELEFAISQWREKPFRPHTVARFRPVAYQKTVVMEYLQALIDCGDYHFRMDTMESIVMATQYYMLAHKLLGDKPRVVPPVAKPPYQTYNQIEADLDAFGNALVELENLIPDLGTLPEDGDELPPVPSTLASLYFCIPLNEKMVGYWDTIEDRLWKIRHCRNIDGVERTLALFAPPIDPGDLVRAAAAGLDIGSIIAGMNAPLPHYRFLTLSQKATELVQEVRSLGSALLQALEKKDAEEMSLLQNGLEKNVLKQMREIKQLQIEEADEQIGVLNKSKETTQERFDYYSTIERIIANEQLNLDKLAEGQDFQMASQIVQATGAVLGLIPDFNIGGHGAGGSPAFHATFGGSFLAEAAGAASSVLNILSSMANYQANRASILGGYDRRWEDWKLQERTADRELQQLDQQIVVAEITKTRNEKDLENHDIQIENNEKTGEFLQDKYTNKQLYQWMVGEISGVYFRAYQLAFEMAKKAEKSFQHELGTSDTFIDFGYWDSMKKGLLSADELLHDLKRMEVSYLDRNKREYEVTRHISLDSLDPLALSKLRSTASCDFEIPEALYDMDHPGQYFRRIKSVSISIPCIAGPYTSVSGKLSQTTNRYRRVTDEGGGYPEDPGNDSRFVYNVGTIQSIATSSGQNDSGLFEFNFRDERFLPFEGTGAISTWRFELPEMRNFDYHTIRDVILHVRYTSREGGSTLKGLAHGSLLAALNGMAQELGKTGMHKAISLRHEMPFEWHELTTAGEALITISQDRLPYFVQPLGPSVSNVIFLAKVAGNPATITLQVDDQNLDLNQNWQLNIGETDGSPITIDLDTEFKLNADAGILGDLEELMMVVKFEV